MYFPSGVYVGRSEPLSCEILVFDVVCNHCSTYEQTTLRITGAVQVVPWVCCRWLLVRTVLVLDCWGAIVDKLLKAFAFV